MAADIFRSAFTYISGGANGESERGSELIGEIVEMGEMKLKVKKVIAEGNLSRLTNTLLYVVITDECGSIIIIICV